MSIEQPTKKPETKTLTFKKNNGEKFTVECEKVDLSSPKFDKLFDKAELFVKEAIIQARQVKENELVTTELDATSNTAKKGEPGDWIVTNPGGEEYVVKDKTFRATYSPIEGKKGFFKTKENEKKIPVKAIKVDKNIFFMAPWGSEQGVQAGGCILERTDNKERYGIEETAFNDTYIPFLKN